MTTKNTRSDTYCGDHEVSIVDLSAFTANGDAESKRRAAIDLREKLKVNGCIGIVGHGVSQKMITEAFAVAKEFFDMPMEEKMKAPHPDAPVPHRGYSRPDDKNHVAAKTAKEMTSEAKKEMYSKTKDFKEAFDLGSEENRDEPNTWLPKGVYDGFREFTLKFYWELNKTSLAILDALIISLDLTDEEADRVRALHPGHDHQLRLLHYPPVARVEAADKLVTRMGAHTDWSTFTLLFQDTNGGLMYMDRATDTFVDAAPIDNVVYMNIGDMFERISNGIYPSALHQVVIHKPQKSRYSIPYFMCSLGDGVIEPQPSLVKRMGFQKYDPVTTMEYSTSAFQTVRDASEVLSTD
ncbi:putative leucoanthocyanidin dioxygenase [Aaosphaeria arxii CBS 175.79]|uniref:Putative leucoanthocyanidin dioxygenase n=1 Tax=Aaosphaeria arxii CBS 175.79 TaxID=1450172 RepID=A0A6A5X943_9PLEO|nr:putative leucoanthocyanidin dioxygenase [Aaosphaeria arxii CBS 175.79]KAF2009430.1 putative leucoanthocyanidin dioxygenase [Aaosphaeria arxii CBS 175.79]